MRILQRAALGVDQGQAMLFSAFEDGGPMWTGEGPRQHRQPVRFSRRFRSAPVVHVALAMWDVAGGPNARLDITAEEVTARGFTLLFRTWGDTRVARVRASWLAIGELPTADDWDIDE